MFAYLNSCMSRDEKCFEKIAFEFLRHDVLEEDTLAHGSV